MKNLDELINIYRSLLNTFWGNIAVFASEDDGEGILNDWKQANWELIVECNLYSGGPVFVQPYGEGADYYGKSSRILNPEALPTHNINCLGKDKAVDLLTGNPVAFPKNGFPLECFVTIKDGWYYEAPPFDCVLILKEEDQFVISLEEVKFILSGI